MKTRFYLVHKLRYKYFRFAGRHLEFLDSPYEFEILFLSVTDPEIPWGYFTPPLQLPHGYVKIELPYEEIYEFEVQRPPSWIFRFQFLPVWPYNIVTIIIRQLDLENMSIAVRMSLLSCVQSEIHAFEFQRPPSWIFPLPVLSQSILTSANGKQDPESKGKAAGIPLISCSETAIHTFEVQRPSSWIFPLPVWSHSLPTSSSGLLEPQHLAVVAVAVGILCLSCLGAELFAFAVLERHLGLSTSGLIVQYPNQSRWSAGPQEHTGSCWNFVDMWSTS